jgi:hypothetical protein
VLNRKKMRRGMRYRVGFMTYHAAPRVNEKVRREEDRKTGKWEPEKRRTEEDKKANTV